MAWISHWKLNQTMKTAQQEGSVPDIYIKSLRAGREEFKLNRNNIMSSAYREILNMYIYIL